MATGTIPLHIGSANPPDGTASNKAPKILKRKSSSAAPAPYRLEAAFDPNTGAAVADDQYLCWGGIEVPADYASGLVFKFAWKMASATANNVVDDARIGAVTSGDAVDVDAKGFAAQNLSATLAVPGTAGYLTVSSITLTNNDGVAAGDIIDVYFGRVGSSANDTAAGDQEVTECWLEYVTS